MNEQREKKKEEKKWMLNGRHVIIDDADDGFMTKERKKTHLLQRASDRIYINALIAQLSMLQLI